MTLPMTQYKSKCKNEKLQETEMVAPGEVESGGKGTISLDIC